MQHARHNRLRRAVSFAVLAAVLGLASLTLSQCTMVGDSLTGVSLDRRGATDCQRQCKDAFKADNKRENKIRDQNLLMCESLPEPDRSQCIADENARYQAALAAISAARTECENDCHRQGAGSAG